MPAPYDYATSGGYARTRADWVDFPSTSTPITQTQLDQIDQAITDLKKLTYNVMDYDADGGGTVDDTTPITNAIAAASNGGIVFFPPGTYKITSAITLPRISQKGLALMGAGARVTKVTYSGSNYCFNFGGGSVADYAQHQGISNMFIDMSASATPTGAVAFKSGFYNYLERVSILGPTGGSKILVYFDPGDGSYGNYHDQIYNCVLQGQTSASDIGIKLHSTTANGANSNFVRDSWFGVFNQSVLIDGGDSNRITGNEFNGTTTTGIKVQTSGTTFNKIMENQFDGPTTCVDIGASVANTTVADNTGGTAYVNAGIDTHAYNNEAIWTGSGSFVDYFASITAAAALVLPSSIESRNVIRVDGTANITSITGARAGLALTFHFTGTASGTGVTDGSTLKLAGNFVYTPDDTITLFFDGTDWREICRSVN